MAELKIINLEDVEIQKINWLWYPYIPFGKITIIQGDPGDGKTTLALRLAALLTKGEALPEDDTPQEPINIIYQTAEDGIADTVKPRLLDAGADCSKVKIIDETDCPLSMLDERIEQALIETGARVLILDPIQSYVGANINMNTANEVRSVMSAIGKLAEKYNCAILLIGHMNKTSAKSSYRGLGSIDFQAAARSVLIVGRLKENEQIRVVAHCKSSLAPEGEPIAFELNKETGFKWLGWRKIEHYSDQIRLVAKEKFATLEDIENFVKTKDLELAVVSKQRDKLRNKLRNAKEPDVIAKLKADRNDCTATITALRKEQKTAFSIIEEHPKIVNLMECEVTCQRENDHYGLIEPVQKSNQNKSYER